MPRSRTIDRALMPKSRVSRIITVAILLIGVVVLIWVFSPGERQRRELISRLEFGDDSDRVAALLGPAAECPPRPLDHLRGSFPEDLPPVSAEAALQRLSSETMTRWVYPLDRREVASCEGGEGQTEIGFDAEGTVLWYVAITGKTALQLPGEYTPEAAGT